MFPNKFAILIFAAAAGFAVYKAQLYFLHEQDPSETGGSSNSFYENVNGSGSLVQTYKSASADRDKGFSLKPSFSRTKYSNNTIQGPVASGMAPGYNANGTIVNQQTLDTEELVDDLPLIQAAAKGNKRDVEERLSDGARVDSRDAYRRTALMYAAWNGNEDICVRLLAAGANPGFKDRDGNNAFDFAASRGLSNVVSFLLKYAKMTDDKHYHDHSKLMQAVYAGNPALLPEGSNKLATVNRITPEGQSPLHLAAANGSIELMKALIARGATVDITNVTKQTPLLWAAWNNQPDALQLLLQKGANINKADTAGNTAVIMAAQNDSLEAVKLLVAQGADIRISNKLGKNALIIAEDTNHNDLLPYLK